MGYHPFFAPAVCVVLLAIAGSASSYEDREVQRPGAHANQSETGMLPRAQDPIETEQEDRGLPGGSVGDKLVHAAESFVAKVDAPLTRSFKSSTTPHREQMDDVVALVKTPPREQIDQVKPLLNGDEIVPSVEPPRIIDVHRKDSIDDWFDSEEYAHARKLFETSRPINVADKKLLSSANGKIVAEGILGGMKTFRPFFEVRPEEAQFAEWFMDKRSPRWVAEKAVKADTTGEHRNEVMTVNAYYEFIDRLMNVVRGRHLPTSATGYEPVISSPFIPFDGFYNEVVEKLDVDMSKDNFFELYWTFKNGHGNVPTQRDIYNGKTRSSDKDVAVWVALERAQFTHWFETKVEPENALVQAMMVAESNEHRRIANAVIDSYKEFIKEQLDFVVTRQLDMMEKFLAPASKK